MGGTPLPVSGLEAEYSGYGLPNNLKWIVTDPKPDVPYTVTIRNVMVKGMWKDYSYEFTLR